MMTLAFYDVILTEKYRYTLKTIAQTLIQMISDIHAFCINCLEFILYNHCKDF